MSQIDRMFGVHADALALQGRRMQTLASNLANADTPDYLARDIDFSQVLSQKVGAPGGALNLAATQGQHLGGVDGVLSTTGEKYRVPLQPSADGNTVDAQVEQAAYADAAMHYQASLSFLDGRLKSLVTAITGS